MRQRAALTEVADVARVALNNLTNSYNASWGPWTCGRCSPPSWIGDGLDPRALLCNLLVNQPGLPNVLAQPADPALTQLARASVVCGAILGNGTGGRRGALGLSLAPITEPAGTC